MAEQNGVLWLVDFIFNLVLFLFTLRFVVEAARCDFRNPVCQWLAKMTQPLVYPLSRVIPSYHNWNLSCLVLVYIVAVSQLLALSLVVGHMPPISWLLLAGLAKAAQSLVDIVFWSVIVVVVLSWVNPHSRHPAVMIIHEIVRPLMALVHRVLPPFGGLDLSPIIVIIALKLVEAVAIVPLLNYGGS